MPVRPVLTVFTLIVGALVISACDSDEKTGTDAAANVEECPTSFWHLREETGPVKCSLKPDCSQAGGLFGSNPYLANGGICSAAVQTGMLKDKPIVLNVEIFERTDEVIEGSDANGVSSASPSGGQPDPGTQLMSISLAE